MLIFWFCCQFGEAKLREKKCPAARETRHEEILIQRNVTRTEMLMKSDNIKRCTYMYIALLSRQLARIRTKIVNSRHCTVNAKKTSLHGDQLPLPPPPPPFLLLPRRPPPSQYAGSALNLGDLCKDIKQKDLLCLLAHVIYHNGWVLVEFNCNPLYCP